MDKIKTQEEADKVKWELFTLERKIEVLKKPLQEFHEEKDLLERKRQYEGKTFHNPNGSGVVHVIEVTKHELICIVVSGFYSHNNENYNSAFGTYKKEFSVLINISFPLNTFYGRGESIGLGESYMAQIEEVTNLIRPYLLKK
jgi:hypothetical protein